MIVIVTGSRDWNDFEVLRTWIDHIGWMHDTPFSVILHGAANGVDQLAERYARERNIPVISFPADWSLLGNKAGPIRNQQMVDWAVKRASLATNEVKIICIAFPLPGSKGTWDCVRRCERAIIKTYVWGLD